MLWLHRAVRNLFFGSGLVLILAGGGFYVLTRTQLGYDVVLARGLDLLQSRIDGLVTVSEVSSANLLQGVTLRGIAIDDAQGRPVLRADSVRARYSLWGLIRGQTVLSNVQLWRPRLVLEQLPGDSVLNVVRVFAGGPAPDDATVSAPADSTAPAPDTASSRIALNRVQLHDGELEIVLATEHHSRPSRLRTEAHPDGGHVSRLTFREIEADLPDVVIREAGQNGERVEARKLSFVGEVFESPFVITDFRGDIARQGGEVRIQADRLWLPETEAGGDARIAWGGDDGVELDIHLDATVLRFEDFRWLEPRLPAGGGRLSLSAETGPDGTVWRVDRADIQVGASRIQGTAGVLPGAELRLVAVDLLVNPLELSELDGWLPQALPVPGQVNGRIQMNGPLRALRVDAALSHLLPGEDVPSTTGHLEGTLRLTRTFGATDAELVLEPADYRIASLIQPAIELDGTGALTVRASGALADSLAIEVDATHGPPEGPTSRVVSSGVLRTLDGVLQLDLTGQLEPLSLPTLARLVDGPSMQGEVSGSFTLTGPLAGLVVAGQLGTPAGRVDATARVNLRNPGASYWLSGEVADLNLARIFPNVPDPTRLSGTVELEGSGLTADSLSGRATVELANARVGHLRFDRSALVVRAHDRLLDVDSLLARTSAGTVTGTGTIGLVAGAPGEMSLALVADSLTGIRPFLLGDTVIAADTLSDILREDLLLRGIDPDTLPDLKSVEVEGRLRAEAVLNGSIDAFSASGTARLEEFVFGTSFVRSGGVSFKIDGLPRIDEAIEARIVADSLGVAGRRFASGLATVSFAKPSGEATIELVRGPDEDLRARGDFEVDTLGFEMRLQEASLRFEESTWSLASPSDIAWDDNGLRVREFVLRRPGDDPLEVRVDGSLPRSGAVNFEVAMTGVQLSDVARLAQLDREVDGKLDLNATVTGTARSPIVEGRFNVAGARFEGLAFSSLAGDLDVRDRRLTGALEARDDSDLVLTTRGEIPLELSLRDARLSFPPEELDIRIRADSLPAAAVMSFVEGFEDVQGTVTGEIAVAGTVNDLSPSGRLQLEDGRATMTALGVRHRDVDATAELTPDGIIRIDGGMRARGRALVQGTLRVDTLANPGFDLNIMAADFEAVNRRDVTGRVSGNIHLSGRYRRPFVTGALRVDEGILVVEEFVRAAEVVDLSDPAFFDVVDTSLVAVRPILLASQNPFLNNLRVDIDLTVDRNAWIRSREMNVEMAGELGVLFDRNERDFVLVGALQSVRGTYTAWGRQFQVQDGTVGFVGTPGLDPTLNIRAVNRLRRRDEDPLNIIATVGGTLVAPRVSLSSDHEPPLAQSELISYLIFGRPSALLASGERSVLRGATGAGLTLGLGTFANQLGSVVAQEIGVVDYFAVTSTQEVEIDQQSDLESTLATTQIELGRYLTQDLFVAALLYPFSGLSSQVQYPGVRLEWRFSDAWTWEGFSEGRFIRQQGGGLDPSFGTQRVFGLSLFWEGGY